MWCPRHGRPEPITRRRLLQLTGGLLASLPLTAFAEPRVPIADMHSHYGMVSRKMDDSGLADDMRAQGVALVAWKLIADRPWVHATPRGLEPVGEPAPGEAAKHFDITLGRMRAYVSQHGLRTVLTAADVDACLGGEPGVVLASEGAYFLEGRVEALEPVQRKGLRHLQLIHYVRSAVGDSQTAEPTHNGLSPLGRQIIEACNASGVLIDLAHASAPAVEQALGLSKAPMIWSHGWVDSQEGSWRDSLGYLQRRITVALARKIAARDGVVGVWGLGLSRGGGRWPVTQGDTREYARELARLVDKIGADHVAIGTDIEGVGPSWSVNDYGGVRKVVEQLERMKLGAAAIERVAYRNYARVLRAALAG